MNGVDEGLIGVVGGGFDPVAGFLDWPTDR